jgi:hypothetical protein
MENMNERLIGFFCMAIMAVKTFAITPSIQANGGGGIINEWIVMFSSDGYTRLPLIILFE